MIVVFLLFFLFYNYTRLLNSFIPFVGGGGGGGVRPVEFRSLMGPNKLVWSIDGVRMDRMKRHLSANVRPGF